MDHMTVSEPDGAQLTTDTEQLITSSPIPLEPLDLESHYVITTSAWSFPRRRGRLTYDLTPATPSRPLFNQSEATLPYPARNKLWWLETRLVDNDRTEPL